ncbi:DUF6603 domain-containing protein [Streptomyces sp. NPDC002088]|uniref:DUF6603 domain-containing protein n=1 Tax=Streptomyces sp. NPDC002088 TaxID=3154665 RepID=UPI00332BED89
MSFEVSGLGPLLDLATAIGLVRADGEFDPQWFSDPGARVGRMLRDQGQREALLRAADELLAQGAPPLRDAAGRRWIPLIAEGGVALHAVLTAAADGPVELGVGARLTAADPRAEVTAYVPLLSIPENGPVTVPIARGTGRIAVDATVTFASETLDGINLSAEVATDGSAPDLSVTLRGLRLPGQAEPADFGFAGGEEALQTVLGIVRQSVAEASGELAELLALAGIGADPAIPALPIAGLLTDGVAAWRDWLDDLIADPSAVAAWLGHLAALAGHGATVEAAAGPGLPHRVRWTVGGGISVAAVVRTARDAGGVPVVDLGLECALAATGTPPGGLEVAATLTRVTLGGTPSVTGLPAASVTGRIGPSPGPDGRVPPADRLVDQAVKLGALRAGLTLGEDRRAALVLAALDVELGEHRYPVLDLTNTQTLADVADTALRDLAGEILDLLGPAGTAVRVLLGVTPPPGQPSWPVPLTPLPDLLADPVGAVVAYHSGVLEANRAGYAALLGALGDLFSLSGAAVTGIGQAEDPWRLPLEEDGALVSVVAWTTDTHLTLGLAVDAQTIDLGGGCPTVTLTLVARLAEVAFNGTGGQALPGVSVGLVFGARGGIPVRIGDPTAAIVVDRIGVEAGWTPGDGLTGGLVAPGLRGVIDGEEVALALPRLTPSGTLAGDVPWRGLELLSGHLMRRLGHPWADELVRLLGWLPAERAVTARLPAESLAYDPVGALRGWIAELVRAGRVADLATALALVLTGPAGPGLSSGGLRGRGDAAAPLAVALTPTAAALKAELLLWAGHTADAADMLRPGELDGRAGPEQIAAALAAAAAGSDVFADLLSDRGDTAAGLAALVARWTDTDGLVPSTDAALPQGYVHDLPGVTHTDLPTAGLPPGITLDAGTVVVSGPLGVESWPGVAADHVTDLRAAGLAPEAFDIGLLAEEDGPWLVLLPSRSDAVTAPGDDGAARQADRLARAVDAVSARIAGAGPVTVIGYGAAGHAAAAVASRPGVTHLVTIGTPHGGISLDVLESQPVAGALNLLAALLPPLDENRPEPPALTRARGLLAPLLRASESTAPLADLTSPSPPPVVPPEVELHCVRGRCDAASVIESINAVVAAGLEESTPLPTTGAGLGMGLGVALDPPAVPGEIHITADLALTGAAPGLRARIGIGRTGGWLAGGPDPARPAGVARHPSLRRATIEVDLPAAGSATARLVFHEACALGLAKRRWVIGYDGSGDPLLPEALILAGRLAEAIGRSTAEPVRALAELMDALGLMTGAGFSVEGLRHLLVDPGGLFAGVSAPPNAGRVATALARLLGTPLPSAAQPARLAFDLDGVTFEADLVARTVLARAGALAIDAGAALAGELELRTDGTLRAELSAALGPGGMPGGRPVLFLNVTGAGAAEVRLEFEGAGAAQPQSVMLAPVPDLAGLHRTIAALVPAQLLWAGVTFLRSLDPGAVALADPALRVLGLLTESDEVTVPFGLVTDPGHWLTHPAILGSADPARAGAVLDALAPLFGFRQPRPGTLTLPYGLELTAENRDGRATVTLRLTEPVAGAGLRVTGSLGLGLSTATLPAGPVAELVLALPDGSPLDSAGRIALTLGTSGLGARLVMPGRGIDLALLPDGPGLAELGTAAVAYALPLVLDAVAALPPEHPARPVGDTLAAFGDATGLRVSGHFSGPQIQALAASPGPELATRLAGSLPAALDALAGLLTPALPTGYSLARQGTELVFTAPVGQIRLTVPAGGVPTGVQVTGAVTGLRPLTGTTLGATITITPAGLAEAAVTFAADPAAGLGLGPITLAPVAEIAIGPASDARVAVGLAADSTRTLSGVFRFGPPAAFAVEATGGSLAEVAAALLLPPAVDLALATEEVHDLLGHVVLGGPTIAELLEDVVLTHEGTLDRGVLDPDELLARLLRLASTIAAHSPALPVDPLIVRLSRRDLSDSDQVFGIAVSLPPGGRYTLADGDVTLDVEVDDTWITGADTPDGLVVELLRVQAGKPDPFFGITVRGLGLRVSRTRGPLLDTFLAVDSVAVHTLVTVTAQDGVTDAGGQVELAGLRIPLGSATGGSNPVAAGVLRDAADGDRKPEPKFSPAFAVQRHGADPAEFALRAGPGDGPWWLPIQRSFGPVYIEQVGFGVTRSGERVIAAQVMVDGRISLLGLAVSVDDLALGARWPQSPGDPPLYDPQSWEVGLAGLGVAADTAGVVVSGGLRRAPGALPDYLGMISIRFGVYGISAYGGYGVVTDPQGEFTSLFVFGALNAPIGGPPAFFVTGIGAGVGVNRQMLLPADVNDFPAHPLLRALDAGAPPADPDTALDALRAYFPPSRGTFWFAAGLSFTSFTLVEGIAVVGVVIGDGLDVNLIGLARAALPNPDFPLVQLELALVARFSSREGVLWVQAQLTDNSFLLTRDCRLTGGFAYVMWFSGDKAGEFVLTMGGYHPSFHRDGYPVVPRLGFVWTVSSILVIKGESYFALTSEAIMAGTRFEASLTAGPLWAYLRLGADAIVFFDPFRFQVTAYAELGAGITIDVDLGWFGHIRITIAVHLHADVELEGPEFHGKATIDLDVTSATITFGDPSDRSTPKLAWPDFDTKYLRPGNAEVLTVVPGKGTLPPGTAGEPPTGGTRDPYLLLPEFVLTVTTTAATSAVDAGGPVSPPFPVVLAIGPMQLPAVTSTLSVSVTSSAAVEYAGTLAPAPIIGQFPKGVWGPQPQSEPRPVPTGETVAAVNGVTLTAEATVSPGTVEIDYAQVEIGPRHQLPFLAERAAGKDRAQDVAAAAAAVEQAPTTADAVLETAREWLTGGVHGVPLTPLAAAGFAQGRVAPPQLVPLAHRMQADPLPAAEVPPGSTPEPPPEVDTTARPPRVEAVLTSSLPLPATPSARTTVGDAGAGLPRTVPPRPGDVQAGLDPRYAVRLVTAAPSAAAAGARRTAGAVTGTVVGAGRVPATGRAGSGGEIRRRTGQFPWRRQRMDTWSQALHDAGAGLQPGEVVVLTAPEAHYDIKDTRPALVVSGDLPVRVVALDTVGAVTLDVTALDGTGAGATVPLPKRTERVALIGGGSLDGAPGWHTGTRLAQVGARTLLGPGCALTSTAAATRRPGGPADTAFVTAAAAVHGYSIVTTRLPAGLTAVAVVLEAASGIDDERADVLDLGLTGARRTAEPVRIIVAGSRSIAVYGIRPNGRLPVEVTVASGEHLHLGGVLGSHGPASELAAALAARDLAGTLARLITTSRGTARVRWTPQEGR